MRRLTTTILALCVPAPALCVDAVTGASRREQQAGNAEAELWITGRGFQVGATVAISGNGITERQRAVVVPEAARGDGGRGDGIAYYFAIAPDAAPGARDVTVTDVDGTTVTRPGAVEILPAGEPPPPPPPDAGPDPVPGADAGPDPDPDPDPDPPPPPRGNPDDVDVVTRASPSFGAQGEQVNLWVVGASFQPGLSVAFSNPALGPAEVDGAPLPVEVVRNAEEVRDADGQVVATTDGIQYFLRIPQDAAPGRVDVTVTNPNGTSAVGARLFNVVRPGERPAPEPGDGDIDGLTGASPRAARAGHAVSLWVWGNGIEPGATVRFDSPSITAYDDSEVVAVSTSHPGFSGVRNFLNVSPDALPGPVAITVTNPNGTVAQAGGIFEIVEDAAGGGGAYVDDGGPCPDNSTTIEGVSRVSPDRVDRGETVQLTIEGRAFACGASIRISGGGLKAIGEPRLVREADDPLSTALLWEIEVEDGAEPGARDVTVINPNNSSKTFRDAFTVLGDAEGARQTGAAFCAARPGATTSGWWWLALLGIRRRR